MNSTASYYHFTVCRNLEEYVEEIEAGLLGMGEMKRKAFSLASSLISLVDYMWNDYSEKLKKTYSITKKWQFVNRLKNERIFTIDECSINPFVIKLIFDVANVGKHCFIDQHDPCISLESQILELPVRVQHTDRLGDYYSYHCSVSVNMGNEINNISLSEYFYSVWLCFSEILKKVGCIDETPHSSSHVISYHVSRAQATLQPPPQGYCVKGTEYKLGYVFMKYDRRYPYNVRNIRKGEFKSITSHLKLEAVESLNDLINIRNKYKSK